MAKIIVGAAMLVAGIALMIYCGPMGAAAMMALYGAIASTGFSMVLGGIAQKLQGQYSPFSSCTITLGFHRLTIGLKLYVCPLRFWLLYSEARSGERPLAKSEPVVVIRQ